MLSRHANKSCVNYKLVIISTDATQLSRDISSAALSLFHKRHLEK